MNEFKITPTPTFCELTYAEGTLVLLLNLCRYRKIKIRCRKTLLKLPLFKTSSDCYKNRKRKQKISSCNNLTDTIPALGLFFPFFWTFPLLEISWKKKQCHCQENVDLEVRMPWAGYELLWASFPPSLENEEDNTTDLIWLFHNSLQGISKRCQKGLGTW